MMCCERRGLAKLIFSTVRVRWRSACPAPFYVHGHAPIAKARGSVRSDNLILTLMP